MIFTSFLAKTTLCILASSDAPQKLCDKQREKGNVTSSDPLPALLRWAWLFHALHLVIQALGDPRDMPAPRKWRLAIVEVAVFLEIKSILFLANRIVVTPISWEIFILDHHFANRVVNGICATRKDGWDHGRSGGEDDGESGSELHRKLLAAKRMWRGKNKIK